MTKKAKLSKPQLEKISGGAALPWALVILAQSAHLNSVVLYILGLPTISACTVHLLIALSMVILGLSLRRSRERNALLYVALILTIGVGGWALPMTLLHLFSFGLSNRGQFRDEDWLLSVGQSSDSEDPEKLCKEILAQRAARKAFRAQNAELRAIALPAEATIIPFVDIMRWGTLSSKQRTLTQIARSFSPSFMQPITMALSDSMNLVRVQAASTVGTLDARFLEREFELVDILHERPEDTELKRELALHRAARSRSGVLDPVMEVQTRTQAISALTGHLQQFPRDADTAKELGQLLLEHGQAKEAAEVLAPYLFREGALGLDICKLYASALFQAREFVLLRETLKNPNYQHESFKSTRDFWLAYGHREASNVSID